MREWFLTEEFRVSQEFSPELWNPVTGEIRYLPDFKSKEGYISGFHTVYFRISSKQVYDLLTVNSLSFRG